MRRLLWICFLGLVSGCSTMPEPKVTPYSFPKGKAFLGEPDRPFKPIGLVRAKVEYTSLDPGHDEVQLCRNYFNKAARDLVANAKRAGGDAVVGVRSVVFLMDGRKEAYDKPECSDDGEEGQALAEGVAVKWTEGTDEKPAPIPAGWLTPLKEPGQKGPELAPPPH